MRTTGWDEGGRGFLFQQLLGSETSRLYFSEVRFLPFSAEIKISHPWPRLALMETELSCPGSGVRMAFLGYSS